MFSDDIVLVGESFEDGVNGRLKERKEVLEKKGLRISKGKAI